MGVTHHRRRAPVRRREPTALPRERADSPTISVIIPTLNEARNLLHVLPRVPDWVSEVIVVDGFSNDESVQVALESRDDVTVLLTRVRGKGAAMRAGFQAATGDIVVALDADGSTDPGELAAFVGLLISGADVVMGSRFAVGGGTEDMELYRRAGNWALTRLVRVAFGGRFSDLCYGYVAFWRDMLPLLDGPFTGFEVETVLHIRAVRAGLRIAEVPSFEAKRIWGISNLRTMRDGARVLSSIVSEWNRNRAEPLVVEPAYLDLLRSERPGAQRASAPPWRVMAEPASTLEELA
jgi:glycosyltransferase involved in cell wall biosynthesis